MQQNLNDYSSNRPPAWRHSRYGFAAFWLLSMVVGWLALRLVLFFAFRPAGLSVSEDALAFLVGLERDFLTALLLTLPLLFWLAVRSETRLKSRFYRALFWATSFVFWFGGIFLLFVEYFFFEEFRSRFNTVAIDYVLFPREVFVNIWESYHVAVVLGVCGVLALVWLMVARKLFPRLWERPFSARGRLLHLGAGLAVAALLLPTVHINGVRVSNDRSLNEIANNDLLSLVDAAWTHNLDYSAFYKTMGRGEAYERARKLLAEKGAEFVEAGDSIRRRVAGAPTRPRLNVVIFLEESLGSEFWGCLGRTNQSLTPEMDKLATQESLLFTNIYASGNRTVRGMEGVLSSFPPLPGDSIVKRNLSDNVETIARILKRDGYSTLFLYGGRGLFDDMRSFAVRNGYDRFIEEKHFEHPTFTTIWGVCDEDLYARSIEEFRALAQTGRPFFATILSVSNHKPYTYPKGRIPEDPEERRRENAVKYADFALGRFFREARHEAFWTNTIFVVVADHGARVYGEQSIPIFSYEIPLVITGPAVVKQPARIPELGCSLDVAPTVLGLIGRPYETLFFGHDLLKCGLGDGRAFLNHNRDIGMLSGERMVVLGLMKTVEFYSGDPKRVQMKPLTRPGDSDRELENNAIAIFQVADDLYMHQRYHLDTSAKVARAAQPN